MFKNIADLDVLANDAICVKHFATMDLIESHPDAPALEVLALMTANDFDIVPISDGEQQLGFVSKVEIEKLHDSEPVRKVLHPINEAVMVSPNASLQEAFERLAAFPDGWFFVWGKSKPQGIVTFDDLGKPAVSLYLLAKILMLEAGLRRLLGTYTNTPIPDTPSPIPDTHSQDYIDGEPYSLSTVVNKIKKQPSLYSDLGFDSGKKFDKGTGFIIKLRNHFAHGRSILASSDNLSEAILLINKIDSLIETVSSKIESRGQVWDAFIKSHIVERTTDDEEIFWVGANAIPLPMKAPIFVISAENPFEQVLEAQTNDRRTECLSKLLNYRRLKSIKVIGQSSDGNWKQASFVIERMNILEACKLAEDFGQRAIFELDEENIRVISIDGVTRKEEKRNR
ncbi:MAG: DUF3293 domain-containing protein [Pseudanabaena sp. CAN_BIN31]|nr:DUF3293 domain-containing protein [Pseudanabaena sp. CAN_BIN31]